MTGRPPMKDAELAMMAAHWWRQHKEAPPTVAPVQPKAPPIPSPGACFAAALRLELAEAHGYPDVWEGDGIYAGRQKD